MNAATKARIALLYPDFQVRCKRFHAQFESVYSISLICHEGIRTFKTQQERWDQGRTTPGKIVTYSKPGFSRHHYGIATDWIFPGPDPYLEQMEKTDAKKANMLWDALASHAESFGMFSGRRYKSLVDSPHVEMRYGGKPIDEIMAVYKVGGLKGVWTLFDRVRGVPVGSEWDGPEKNRLISFTKNIADITISQLS